MNKELKAKQNELKEVYRECLKDVWSDNKMIDYCMKKVSYIVELSNGDIITIDKPNIQKDFCYGYGYCGITNEEDENRANDMVTVAKSNTDYFMRKNLEQVQGWIDELNNLDDYNEVHVRSNYYSQSKDNTLKQFYIYCPYSSLHVDNEHYRLDNSDIEKIIKGYEIVKEEFTKRLNTYLKRYGLSKINAWTYLSD